MERRSAAFILPRALEGFILEDLVRPLIDGRNIVAIEPGRMPAGAYLRMPPAAAGVVAKALAARVSLPADPAVFILMHPVLWPLANALKQRHRDARLWYGIWDLYGEAPDANAATRAKVQRLHDAASAGSDWRFAVSGRLAQIEEQAGRSCDVIGLPHDSFPAPDPGQSLVVTAMGHLGRRTDWPLLRDLLRAMPELTLLLIGTVHEHEALDPAAMNEVLCAPNCVPLGRLDDDAAARMIGVSDACLLPFMVEPFNDAGLPQRILKAARLGRHTLVPPLAGCLTHERAVIVCEGTERWLSALDEIKAAADHAGDRSLRDWALAQDGRTLLAPLRERLRQEGVVGPDQPARPAAEES